MRKRLFFFRRKSFEENSADTNLYRQLFHFLIKQITNPKNVEQLIQLGQRAPGKGADENFHTYLLFEKYLCSFEQSKNYTPASLRSLIKDLFPDLGTIDPFSILFLTDLEKKNTIAIDFLRSFLSSVEEQFGQAGDGYFERKKDDLDQLLAERNKEETFSELQSLSTEVFQFVNENYGETF